MIRDAIAAAVEGRDLDTATMEGAMDAIFKGDATPAQIGGLLIALRMKGETAQELAAAARVMRRHAVPVEVTRRGPLVDTCGTGGDGSSTFNISTVGAVVVAACGVAVAKHGNRAATSRCGSADVLEALGVNLELPAARIGECIDRVGIGFMFARAHHPAMKHAAPVRAELGVRTLFNLLGPLTNPASATHQLLGVGDGSKVALLAEVLVALGVQGAWVVSALDGLDEMSLEGETRVAEVSRGGVTVRNLTPEDFGLARAPRSALLGGDAAHNAAITHAILNGELGPRRDAVVLNAAAALCACGAESDPRAAAARAGAALDDGSAARVLSDWIAFTR